MSAISRETAISLLADSAKLRPSLLVRNVRSFVLGSISAERDIKMENKKIERKARAL
jgi:hypothetical protein